MLVRPPVEKLLPKVENRYVLAVLVAKRARQLVDGARPLIESDSPNLVTLACEELGMNRIACVKGIVDVYIPLRPDIEAARLAAHSAATQASEAEAIKEELDQIIDDTHEIYDESDARIIADNLIRAVEALPENEELVIEEESVSDEEDQ